MLYVDPVVRVILEDSVRRDIRPDVSITIVPCYTTKLSEVIEIMESSEKAYFTLSPAKFKLANIWSQLLKINIHS